MYVCIRAASCTLLFHNGDFMSKFLRTYVMWCGYVLENRIEEARIWKNID